MSILFDNPPPAIGCGDPGDPIDFSVFMDGNAHFSRNFASGGNRRKCTFHFSGKLVKTSDGTDRVLFNSPQPTTGTNGLSIRIETDRIIIIVDDGSSYWVGKSASLLRDFAGWYSATVTIDMDQPDPENRFILDVDGVRKSLETTAGSIPAQGSNLYLVSGEYSVGRRPTAGFTSKFLGDLSRFIYVDGIPLPSAAFRYTSLFGHPVNKRYTGAFGANGFHLDFADPLDFGKDVSGNGNHFTATGLTVDNQVTDTPTNNFATLNPLYVDSAKIMPTNGNLTAIGNAISPAANNVAGTHIIRHKAFFAMTPVTLGNGSFYIGLQTANGLTYCYRQDGATVLAGAVSAYGAAFAVGDWVGCGYDPATGDIEFFKLVGGAWVSQGILPAAISAADVLPWVYASHQTRVDVNFGQRAWPAQLPDGYMGHSASNMPCPAILNPDEYFTHRVKTGGASVSDLLFNPTVHKALVVSKRIDADEPCVVTDTVNGAGFAWETSSAVNGIAARPQGLIAFTANGYTIGSDTAYQGNRLDLIWRASPRAGFDIVTVDHTTGTPTTVPQLSGGVIEYGWVVRNNAGQTRRMFHHLLGNDRYFPMNAAGGPITDAGWFSSTANTVTLGASLPTGIYTLYVWRSVPQFSSFGRYAPNDSNNGPFLPLDFLPRLFQPNGGGPNGTRSIFVDDLVVNGGNDPRLAFEAAAAAVTTYEYCDFLSNGVKARGVYTPINYSDTDFYYPAVWARTPGKFARAR